MSYKGVAMEENETHKALVISVHGIRTRGAWQKDLTPLLNQADFIHESLDFGFLGAIKILFRYKRNQQVQWFLDKYTEIKYKYPNEIPSVIAHSFGTYIIARAMQLYGEIRFDRIILCGSIIPQGYSWKHRFNVQQVNYVLNECGRKDWVVKLAAWVIKDAGPSGAFGFDNHKNVNLHQRHNYGFRHSDYLYPLNYKENWIPFLRGERNPIDRILEKGPMNWRFLIRNVIFFMSIVLFILLMWHPWQTKDSTAVSNSSNSNSINAMGANSNNDEISSIKPGVSSTAKTALNNTSVPTSITAQTAYSRKNKNENNNYSSQWKLDSIPRTDRALNILEGKTDRALNILEPISKPHIFSNK
jgi:pimeloyl-ACP methyl ester carboxylesterase